MTSEERALAEASILKTHEKVESKKQKFNIKVLSSVPHAKKKVSADINTESPSNPMFYSLSGHH